MFSLEVFSFAISIRVIYDFNSVVNTFTILLNKYNLLKEPFDEWFFLCFVRVYPKEILKNRVSRVRKSQMQYVTENKNLTDIQNIGKEC